MLKRENSADENEKNSKRSKYLDTLVESVKVEIKEDEENQTSNVKETDEEDETYEEDESLNRSDQILPDNIEKAVTNLKQLLSSPIFLGKYSVTGEATQLKSLELELYSKKLGLIRLPIEDNLTLETADLIPSQFEIKNSIWEDKLQELVDHITTEFGYSELKVKPELEKIVLHKKGNDLLKYCEVSEKNLFARLLIQLPSVFKGGELKVYNNETLTRFDFGQSNNKCACSIHFAAFYADLEYEFLEVTNGYQLILAYSLYSDKISDYYSFKNKQSNEISICLKEISLLNNPISIQLEHKYRSKHFYKKISKIDLKGIDRSRFNLLKSANACLEIEDQFSFFFVKAEKHFETENPADSGSECGRTDYFPRDLNSDDEIHPKKTKDNEYYLRGSSIDSWFDNQGNIILNTSGISFSFFSKFIDLKNDTDRNIYRWRYGNNRYYHKFLLTFWPKKLDIKFMSQISFEQAIDLISDDFLNNSQYLGILETFLNKLDTSVIYDDFDFGYNNYELIDQKHYDRLISILKTINNPKFDKIFIDKIKFFKSESLLTNVVYKLWKDSNFKITLFKEIIINLLSKVNIDEEFLLQKDDSWSWEKERMARYRNCEDEIHDRFDKKNIYSFNQYNQYHDKQIEILNELNDLEVIKVYIEKFMRIYCKNKIYEKFKNIRDESCNNFLKSAINLIKIYEWKPIENLFEFLRPVSADNIEYNCTLIKVIMLNYFCYLFNFTHYILQKRVFFNLIKKKMHFLLLNRIYYQFCNKRMNLIN
jgi:hypothetical protein